MSNELENLSEQMEDLAMRGLVLAAKEAIQNLGDVGPIDLRSFVIGGVDAVARSGGVPEPVLADMTKMFVEKIEPYLAADAVEGAFDDLPIFDPGNGS